MRVMNHYVAVGGVAGGIENSGLGDAQISNFGLSAVSCIGCVIVYLVMASCLFFTGS